jgi:hypothetical protein
MIPGQQDSNHSVAASHAVAASGAGQHMWTQRSSIHHTAVTAQHQFSAIVSVNTLAA